MAQPRAKPRAAPPVAVANPGAALVDVPPQATFVPPVSSKPTATATTPISTPVPTPNPATPNPATAESGASAWLYAALAAVLSLAMGGFAWWRRRQAPRALPAPDFVAPAVATTPTKDLVREAIVVPAPDFASQVPRPATAPAVTPAATPPALSIMLEATRMSATLFNATLAYRLIVTNIGPAPLSGIEIGGDMTSAHASRATEEQLGLDGAALAPLHGVAGLAPGESVVLGGELRLPLSAILPIRRGDAQLFVPLTRFSAHAQQPDGQPVAVRRAFLVGQSRSAAAGKLQPFRLDLGPQLYSELGQRALAEPA